MLVAFAIAAVFIVAMWKIYTKAGQPGWASLVPFYNILVMLKIVGKPAWWLVLFFIPIVNFVVGIMMYVALAKAFGKGTGFALGLIFLSPIFFLLLAFGDAEYVGDAPSNMVGPQHMPRAA
ncbi:signal peptidase I [Archangium violaceum]|nr:signal peptidase I [Archangium violaceum]